MLVRCLPRHGEGIVAIALELLAVFYIPFVLIVARGVGFNELDNLS
jgi:hypothetical protein